MGLTRCDRVLLSVLNLGNVLRDVLRGDGGHQTEDEGQQTEDGGQQTEEGGQPEDGGQQQVTHEEIP